MTDVSATLLRLRLAEGRVKRAYNLSQVIASDPTKINLFLANVNDLPSIKDSYDSDHIAVEVAADLISDFSANAHASRMATFEDHYFSAMAMAESLTLNKVETEGQPKSSVSSSSHVALPKITLPCFDGDPRTWMNFSNLFTTLVTNHPQLSAVEKFAYLKTSLSGEALSIVQALPISEANFSIAWESLVSRYQNNRLIVSLHVEALLAAPSASVDSSASLRKLLTVITENVAALEALKVPVDHWDLILLPILCKRLDTTLQIQWEMTLTDTELPKLKNFVTFLEKHCRSHEAVGSPKLHTFPPSKVNYFPTGGSQKPSRAPRNASNMLVNSPSCPLCGAEHPLYKCSSFHAKGPKERFDVVKTKNLCLNCLQSSHLVRDCTLLATCRLCGAKHHSLLHFTAREREGSAPENLPSEREAIAPPKKLPINQSQVLSSFSGKSHTQSSIMLATALIEVRDVSGSFQTVRVLFDSGSQANFMTDQCLYRLGLSRRKVSTALHGLSQTPLKAAKGVASCVIKPRGLDEPRFETDWLVLPHITGYVPSTPVQAAVWSHVSNLQLADPSCSKPGPVDMLIGAELFPYILTGHKREGPPGTPVALSTVFGWILIGQVHENSVPLPECSDLTSLFVSSLESQTLEGTVKRFWELEEPPAGKQPVDPEDVACEQIFVNSITRDDAGRYSVALPFKTSDPDLGDSSASALRRFFSLERRFRQQPEVKSEYVAFMRDYLASGHMCKVDPVQICPGRAYYIPHHCIVKPESTTTKLRVVFDASAKASSGVSLNEMLLTGPKLQKEIPDVLLHFRLPLIVFTADIKQMYRQIDVHPDHRSYQLIYWRESEDQPVGVYQLNTVTYGVSSAPFLALRTLHQLAKDEQANFPHAASMLLTDTYVDDVVSGAETLETALQLRQDLQHLLCRGGFKLRKFASNCPAFLSDLPVEDLQQPSETMSFDEDSYVKVLGLRWNPMSDTFSYDFQVRPPVLTKRGILSDIARIFDPLGWLSPLTLLAKHLIQHLWLTNTEWDAPAPPDVVAKWETVREELQCCSNITIARCLTCKEVCVFQLHGFCDSSEKGYAAVVYLRRISNTDAVTTYLVLAKSKVAPVKKVSLPRLELCAALLLAQCLHWVVDMYSSRLEIEKIYAWSDSSVALSWIRGSPHLWKTFVANRVTRIQEYTSPEWWRHVPTEQNPADCASRGLTPSQLLEHPLWWHGPPWLLGSEESWPNCIGLPTDAAPPCEEQRIIVLQASAKESWLQRLQARFSNLNKIIRVAAFCLRFVNNVRPGNARLVGPLQPAELAQSMKALVRCTQYTEFAEELHHLARNEPCSPSIQRLSPFLDSEGIIRVGGRLQQSTLAFETKHPIVLPKNCRLAELLIYKLHSESLHPGPSTLKSLLLREFWVLGARNMIRLCLRKCMKCFRAQPKSFAPCMASLPSPRVNQAKPFLNSGVDYGGPISITMARVKKPRVLQAYICLFVCLATKAIHLELASDLSTDSFLAALRRFAARRGQCAHIYSDCGTNFVGASRKLSALQNFLENPDNKTVLADRSALQGITWHFNPPSAPHFGGLWEAGIKSVKSHLFKVIGDQLLTYEELSTVLAQIESTLNSRPLCSMSTDPNDLAPLTPSHFLTLGPPPLLPDEDLTAIPENRLSRWQLVQQITQSFWKRWHMEYLHQLQPREKWTKKEANIETGALVLIKDSNLPPRQWRLGRVQKVFPGADGVVRVAEIRTHQGTLVRPVVKLCPLPSQ